jgi:transcriptional regulator with XRE-family HTH domain
MDSPLTQARKDRNWSQARLMAQLRLAARAAGEVLPDDDKLRVNLSRWENGRHRPCKMYVGLLCDALEVTAADLGFTIHRVEQPAAGIGPDAVPYLNSMFELHVRADNAMGSRLLIDVVREQTRQAEQWTREARGPVREPLLRTASRYAEFCGWVHQDQGDFAAADDWTRRAVDMAQELGDVHLVAYGLMRRSNVATESGRPIDGLHLAEAALRQRLGSHPRLTALSLRQKASAHAMRGEVADCRAAVDRGTEAASAGGTSSRAETAYCTVPYMAMEGGQALLTAGDPLAALRLLSTALEQWPAGQDRDRGLCLARLAHAYVDADEPEAACTTARQAVASLEAARSARTEGTLRRLRGRLLIFRRRPEVQELREELAQAV